MEKLGKFPIENCKAEYVEDVAIFQEGDSLETGDTYCSVIERCAKLGIERIADGGVRITCQEDCRKVKKAGTSSNLDNCRLRET